MVTGVEVAVGLLVTWLVGKARRAARRADDVVDQAVDAGVDRVGQLILTRLAGDPAVQQLQDEAAERGEVSDRTTRRVQLAVEEAAEQDPGFAQALTAAVADAQAQAGAAVAGPGGVAVSGGVHSTGSGTAIGGVGSIGTFQVGGAPDPSQPGQV